MSSTRRTLLSSALLMAALSSTALVACGGTTDPQTDSTQPATATPAAEATTNPEAKAEGAARANNGPPTFEPSNFGNPATGANRYLPLIPGTQSVRDGTTIVGGRVVPHQVTTTITDVFREINGIPTVALLDVERDGGQVAQISVDYMAEDRSGNVWLAGGYTENYEGGRFTSAVDPWLDGINGAKAGILVQGNPVPGSPQYSVAQTDTEQDVARVFKRGVRHCVPFKCFNDSLIVREGTASAPDNEFKYYARGVGQIDNVPRGDSVHKDVEQLINLTSLSRKGLKEASAEALRLDNDAPKNSPAVFGEQPVGQRG